MLLDGMKIMINNNNLKIIKSLFKFMIVFQVIMMMK